MGWQRLRDTRGSLTSNFASRLATQASSEDRDDVCERILRFRRTAQHGDHPWGKTLPELPATKRRECDHVRGMGGGNGTGQR